MFSITGLEFAYSEASPQIEISGSSTLVVHNSCRRSHCCHYFYVEHLFPDVAVQMFVFGGIMLLVIFVFILLAIFYYEYADYSNEGEVLTEKMMVDDEHTRI
ncbi:hypothetical protein CRE_15135 [Caenorhabditis remanei]|uniref:Uncharacterized protein n=1 Tax=Caenorhabditis remanei TaxID=31234 RepID=E3NRZ8_CAERE|nr:hypothetical protein CRE_15135 [Caenorhabditis remanei]